MLALQQTGLGDAWADIQKILSKAPQYIETALSIVEDPAMPEVVGLIKKLKAMQPPAAGAAAGVKAPGIGLSAAITPLKAFVWYREHKALAIGLLVAAVVVPVAGAVVAGRRTKRCRTGTST